MLNYKTSSEYQECRAYFEWAQYHPTIKEYLIHHVNEGKRSRIMGNLLKLIGMRKGIPDYQLPLSNNNWHGFWIEMKTVDEHNKKQKKEQIDWINRLLLVKQYATFAFGCDDAIRLTLAYINNKI